MNKSGGAIRVEFYKWIGLIQAIVSLIQLDKVAQYLGTNIEALAFGRTQEDIFSHLLTKTEVHTGLYEISIKKVVKK
jgi:hypothetical protein